MKKTIAILAALVLAASFTAFAQESMTSASTKGIFGTDVDDFMDVNYWSGVNPEKLFAFTYFYSDSLNFGASKVLKDNIYAGAYFSGTLPKIVSAKNVTDTYTAEIGASGLTTITPPTVTGVTFPTITTKSEHFDLSLIMGMGDMGFKFNFNYIPSFLNANVTYKNGDPAYKYNKSGDTYTPGLEWGLTTKLNGHEFTPHAKLDFAIAQTKTEVNDGTATTVTIDGTTTNTLYITAGAGYKFDDEGELTQKVSGKLQTSIFFFPKDTTIVDGTATASQDKGDIQFTLSPAYSLTWTPAKEVKFGCSAKLPLSIDFANAGTVKANTFTITSSVAAAMQLALKPEKVNLNLGAELDFGQLLETSSENNGNSTTTTFFGGDFDADINAGLTFFVTKNVCIDTTYNFITTTATGAETSLDTIWKTNMGFQLSVKF